MLRLEAKQKVLFTVIYLIFQFLKLITESRNLNVWCYISSVKICQMTLFLKNEQKSIKKGLLYPFKVIVNTTNKHVGSPCLNVP